MLSWTCHGGDSAAAGEGIKAAKAEQDAKLRAKVKTQTTSTRSWNAQTEFDGMRVTRDDYISVSGPLPRGTETSRSIFFLTGQSGILHPGHNSGWRTVGVQTFDGWKKIQSYSIWILLYWLFSIEIFQDVC